MVCYVRGACRGVTCFHGFSNFWIAEIYEFQCMRGEHGMGVVLGILCDLFSEFLWYFCHFGISVISEFL